MINLLNFYIKKDIQKKELLFIVLRGGKTGLTKSEISIIDDRIEYYFDNEEYTDDSESLASFVIDGGEIDSSKYKEILQYIESQGYAGDDENDDDEGVGKYSIIVWETEEDRDAGESFVAEITTNKQEALEKAEKMYYKQDFRLLKL